MSTNHYYFKYWWHDKQYSFSIESITTCNHAKGDWFIGLDKQKDQRKILNIFLPIILAYILGAQKNCHETVSFEYTQHMFWLRNKKIIFLVRPLN